MGTVILFISLFLLTICLLFTVNQYKIKIALLNWSRKIKEIDNKFIVEQKFSNFRNDKNYYYYLKNSARNERIIFVMNIPFGIIMFLIFNMEQNDACRQLYDFYRASWVEHPKLSLNLIHCKNLKPAFAFYILIYQILLSIVFLVMFFFVASYLKCYAWIGDISNKFARNSFAIIIPVLFLICSSIYIPFAIFSTDAFANMVASKYFITDISLGFTQAYSLGTRYRIIEIQSYIDGNESVLRHIDALISIFNEAKHRMRLNINSIVAINLLTYFYSVLPFIFFSILIFYNLYLFLRFYFFDKLYAVISQIVATLASKITIFICILASIKDYIKDGYDLLKLLIGI